MPYKERYVVVVVVVLFWYSSSIVDILASGLVHVFIFLAGNDPQMGIVCTLSQSADDGYLQKKEKNPKESTLT